MKTELPPTVSAAVLADLIGVSPRSVTDLCKRGIVVRATVGKGFDLRLSLRGYADHQRKLATGRGGEGAINTATAQRTRLLQEQADAAAIKNKRERGELLGAGEVERTWTAVFAAVRAGVLAASSRVASRLPHLSQLDVAEIDTELRTVLTELGEGKQ